MTDTSSELRYQPFGKWTYPVMTSLQYGKFRFSELQRNIRSISSKCLSDALKYLESLKVIDRHVVIDSRPPVTYYSLSPEGFRVLDLYRQLNGFPAVDNRVECRDGHPNSCACHNGVYLENDLVPHSIVRSDLIPVTKDVR